MSNQWRTNQLLELSSGPGTSDWKVTNITQEVGGIGIISAGVAPWQSEDRIWVFAAGGDFHLLEFHAGPGMGGWQVNDLTGGLDWAWPLSPLAPLQSGDQLRVFAASQARHLLEYNIELGTGGCHVYDHTPEVSGAMLEQGPAMLESLDISYEGQDIELFGIAPETRDPHPLYKDHHLLKFSLAKEEPLSETVRWYVYDLTDAVGGVTVWQHPVALQSGGVVRVFVEGESENLLEFYCGPNTGSWKVTNITQEVGGSRISSGGPAVLERGDDLIRVFAKSPTNHLLEFVAKQGTDDWHVSDRTAEVGGAMIWGNPQPVRRGDGDPIRVFAAGPTNHPNEFHLLEFYSGPGGWKVADLTQELGGITTTSFPAVLQSGDQLRVFITGGKAL